MTTPRITSSRRPLVIVIVAGLVLVAGALLAYALVLKGDDVAPLALPSVAPSSGVASGTGGVAPAASTAAVGAPSLPAASAGTAVDAAGLAGAWKIADGSLVGYRVREKLAELPAQSDAVGRTSSVTGAATLTASGPDLSVTAADFEADLTTLKSDRGMRDNRIRTLGLESDTFPTATFKLGAPIAVPAVALTGAPVDVTLHGDLTIHGTTKAVDIPAKAQLNGPTIQIAGSLTFPFSDFGMTPPNFGSFVSVGDDATLEFLVSLARG
jgi:polyisoprenoid-binding protein YceI